LKIQKNTLQKLVSLSFLGFYSSDLFARGGSCSDCGPAFLWILWWLGFIVVYVGVVGPKNWGDHIGRIVICWVAAMIPSFGSLYLFDLIDWDGTFLQMMVTAIVSYLSFGWIAKRVSTL